MENTPILRISYYFGSLLQQLLIVRYYKSITHRITGWEVLFKYVEYVERYSEIEL
jgi:hypothetical protein